ncbi:MAG: hypothetical protein A2X36_13230 [Elusimicrobia bacterium GWA2_69_24]|nr:MAG: hypothetical protein A2X36_13230 [Elusimicrobia bacterium GWA2_69_24]
MATWEKICSIADIPQGQRKSFPLGALDILVVSAGKHFYACSNECPVGGESLEDGDLQGHVMRCQAHSCRTDLSNGKCLSEADLEIAIFPLELRDGWIWVKA